MYSNANKNQGWPGSVFLKRNMCSFCLAAIGGVMLLLLFLCCSNTADSRQYEYGVICNNNSLITMQQNSSPEEQPYALMANPMPFLQCSLKTERTFQNQVLQAMQLLLSCFYMFICLELFADQKSHPIQFSASFVLQIFLRSSLPVRAGPLTA